MGEVDYNFNNSLAIGEYLEQDILTVLQRIYPQSYKLRATAKEGDLYIPEKNVIVEVKQDEKSDYTGNFAFEYKYRGEPSGLAATKAKLWIMADKNKLYCFKVSDMKSYFIVNWNSLRHSCVKGGDNNASEMLLVKKRYLAGRQFTLILDRKNPDEKILKEFINML